MDFRDLQSVGMEISTVNSYGDDEMRDVFSINSRISFSLLRCLDRF